jgi:hypothetical protein
VADHGGARDRREGGTGKCCVCCIALCDAWQYVVLYCIVLYCVVLCFIASIRHSAGLFCTALYWMVRATSLSIPLPLSLPSPSSPHSSPPPPHYAYSHLILFLPHNNIFYYSFYCCFTQLMESFGAGTAAVICPVKGIIYKEQVSEGWGQGTLYCIVF